jgi:rhomboid family GlyGly-CTERM serine protease
VSEAPAKLRRGGDWLRGSSIDCETKISQPLSLGAATRGRPSRAWFVIAAGAGLLSIVACALPRDALDWQPALAAREPWRAVSAAFVHYSRLHLVANLAGAAMVALLGRAAHADRYSALAWLAAWPLTQFALLLQPELRHYGGLSGVLHAAVAVVAVELLFTATRGHRMIALGLMTGLALKLALEAPWAHVLNHPAGWDIAVAPLAHAAGAMAGVACSLAAEALRRLGPARVR